MEERALTALTGETFQAELADLQQRATKDALSGLLNRATMERCIKKRLQAMTAEETCALFIVDLDDFKQLNDTLGHPAGDQAIRKSGQIISSIFRASDIVGRLGGDEFAIFLCGRITDDLARKKAAAICENLQFAMGDHKVINLTVSVGVYLSAKGQAFEGIYQAADLALYRAKKSGKSRYCLKTQDGYDEPEGGGFRPVNTISLRGILEQLGSGVALLEMGDPPQVIYVSPSYCRILHVDPEGFPLPAPLADLIHPDDLIPLEQSLRDGLQRGAAVEHTHRISGNGGKTWCWWHIRAMQVEYDNPHPVLLITATDISQFKETQLQLEERLRLFQTALDQTSKQLWEVDLSTGTFHAYTRDGKYRPLGQGRMHFPEDLIDGGWIHPDSVARFRSFARELTGGHAQGSANFAIRGRDTGYYSWAAISYRTLFDDMGRAVRAVGVLEALPLGFSRQGLWSPDQYQLPERLVADLLVRMRADLAQDTVEALWIEGADLSGQVQQTRCSQVLRLEREKIFCRGEQQEFFHCFEREALLKAYADGHRWFWVEYRRADSGGSIRWVRHVLFLSKHPTTGHIYLFVYLIRLSPSSWLERATRWEHHRDAVTHLFDRETIRRAAEAMFSNRRNGNRAVAVLQINGLPDSPLSNREALRHDIAAVLSLTLGGSCVLGQYSAHQMVIVFPSVTEKEELRRSLEESVSFLRRMLTADPAFEALRFLVGVHLMPASAALYSAMLSQALQVCAFWWNAAVDTVAFAQEAEDWSWTQLPQAGQEEQVSVIQPAELGRALSDREKDVALDCVSAMLSARTLEASLRGVLETIGAYYRADRVYTLMLVENQRAVIMTFEWASGGRRSIQQVVSGMLLERFPLLERCRAEGAPVFISRQMPLDLTGETPEKRPWYFAALPLIRDKTVEGFLCIENAREHPRDAALFARLIPLMLQQRERFHSAERPTGTTEQLMGIPDLRAYLQTVPALTSEYYSSLGVVCLDVPDLAGINSRLGFAYGNKMLWYIAKTLTDIFGAAFLFRTWDAEFVIFFTNTTREVFLGRCGRLRSILQRRYPRQVRIGRAWADGVFTGKRLADEAKAFRQIEFTGQAPDSHELPVQPETYSSVAEAALDGRFTVYYQPQIDMRDGSLAGAEALVRAVAEDGSIIPPGRFIDFLEEDGSIRELDLFVLEQALSQAEQWRAEGLGIVPVSVNLSRVTLAHSSALASVLAVQSHYPSFPLSALELEVTERGDGLGTDELRELVETFRACGLRMSLDDFGSQYANLSLFTNVKFETVKLDRSLIAELASNSINRTLVRDLVQICRSYGMSCVAEGVETEEQIAALVQMGCVYAQGFYYDRPLPAEAFAQKYLRKAPQTGEDQEGKEFPT